MQDPKRWKHFMRLVLEGTLCEKQKCETCAGYKTLTRGDGVVIDCPECDGDGFIYVGTAALNCADGVLANAISSDTRTSKPVRRLPRFP